MFHTNLSLSEEEKNNTNTIHITISQESNANCTEFAKMLEHRKVDNTNYLLKISPQAAIYTECLRNIL
jgi:hypothetical protein